MLDLAIAERGVLVGVDDGFEFCSDQRTGREVHLDLQAIGGDRHIGVVSVLVRCVGRRWPNTLDE